MSYATDVIDAVLVIVAAQVAGVTTRNALSAGFLPETEVPAEDYPHAQAFGWILEPEDLGEVVQHKRVASFSLMLLRQPNQGAQMATDLEAIRDAIRADPHLFTAHGMGNLVDMMKEGTMQVDEFSSRERTRGGLIVISELTV